MDARAGNRRSPLVPRSWRWKWCSSPSDVGYSVAARARSRTPAVAPTYMSRVVR